MQLEFHQLDRRWEHLRVRQPHRQRRLMASLAESGQQTPIVVVLGAEERERYLVIDGYKRIAALEQLGRDTIEATVWAMSAAEALLLERSLRCRAQESALEQGWLLVEVEQSFGYGLEELAHRFDRSVSWVSRRLALVELLPESIQQQVRKAGGATGHEVSGSDGARQPRRLRANGVGLGAAALPHAGSGTTLHRLAGGLARGPRARAGRAGTVFENAAAGAG
jgi:ParB/RepB/Spo0J family partition protein